MPFLRVYLFILAISLTAFASAQSSEADEKTRETTFAFGGYAKLDWLLSRFINGEPTLESPIRDIYLPSGVPVGGELNGYDSQIHAKESRFNFEVKTDLAGTPIRMFAEMDFLLSVAGDQRVSNSYNPRLRHFFFEWRNFLFGQTWTTFMTTEAIPDGIIFIGGAEGLIFNRQAQARLTYKNWTFAIENPETTLLPYQEQKFTTSSGGHPDFVVKHTFTGEWGVIGLSGIYRTLRYANTIGERFYSRAYGINASGRINVGKRDDLRFMLTWGEGLGRYMALQFITGAVVDPNDGIHSIGSTSGLISYTHHWGPKWKSNFTYSFFTAENMTEFTSGSANHYAWSGGASLLYTPHPVLVLGFQGMYALRELENGTDGAMTRYQFSAKYTFNFEISVQHKTE